MAEVEWIKLTVDMFDNRKIKQLRCLPEGNNIVLIWVMLLTLAGRCNAGGMIFLTENIPYTAKMLAEELKFEENTVRLALEALERFGMIQTDCFLSITNWDEYQNVEGMERIRDQTSKRVARYRERQKAITDGCNVTSNVTVTQSNATDIRIENKNKNTEREKIKGGEFPNLERIMTASGLSDSVKEALREFIKMRKQYKKPLSDNALKLLIGKLTKLSTDEQTQVEIVNQSIESGWLSVYPLKRNGVRQGANGIKLSNEQDHTLDGIL